MTRIDTSECAEIVRANSEKVVVYYDECRSASHRLADDLMSRGHHAEVLRCSGLRTLAPDADRRWHSVGAQKFWIHFVVQTTTEIVDLTRRQFFPTCENPYYQSAAAFAAEWDSFGPELQNPRFHASVAPSRS